MMKSKPLLAIVSGGSRGIGLEIVKQLSESGIHCATISRSKNVEFLHPNQTHFPCDVSNALQVSETIKTITQHYHKTHAMNILINAAGVSHDGLLVRFPQDELEKIIAINLQGTMNICKSSLRYFMLSHSSAETPSSIINISSIIGGSPNMTNIGQSVYAASKAGVVAFSQHLARELLGKHIRVNCVSPGFIETEMTRHLQVASTTPNDTNRQKLEKVKMGKPHHVASLVQYLISPQAEYINGQNIIVDGGLSLL
ncbi:hypothetical protein C9374_013260 [Naegleria lovaniensis]|uniref:Uncharacterized protein n=1 Tax=Naegleria lovaniensis TaxID=51637 RepID=A0AA88GVJ1_NAELO|nr:uncharacterized protein C9374_013260 [Naegleria lovaniensis]KAG2391775.1 hypothetical protein C9374_013260 [Naegleria lovaniensis]